MSSLHRPALILNGAWCALRTTTVRHAVELLVRGAAMAIRPETFELHDFRSWSGLPPMDGEPCLTTVRLRFPAPQAVLLVHYKGFPAWSAPSFSRRNIYRRDDDTCQYCGQSVREAERTIDHVVPRSRGGDTTWRNCVLACRPCNRRKGDRLPDEAGMRLLRLPDTPEHLPLTASLDHGWLASLLPQRTLRELRNGHGHHGPNGHEHGSVHQHPGHGPVLHGRGNGHRTPGHHGHGHRTSGHGGHGHGWRRS